MDIRLIGRAFSAYGAAPAEYRIVGLLLDQESGNYGPGIQTIEITIFFPPETPSSRSCPEAYERHRERIAKLPVAKYFRKKATATIDYVSSVADGLIFDRRGQLLVDLLPKVFDEVSQALHLLDAKIKPKDLFDIQRMHQDVELLRGRLPRTDDELRNLDDSLEDKRQAKIAAMDPWERLDIDWEEYHPDARNLLNDTFFWEQADDDAPHGNDTGADVFADYKKWARRHSNRPAHELASGILKAWDLPVADWTVTDEGKVQDALAGNPLTCDQAMLAVAFGMIKVYGYCDPTTRTLALKAIERERMPSLLSRWRDADARQEALTKMAECLLRVPVVPQGQ